MKVTVKGSDLAPILADILPNKKQMINLECDGNTLTIQVLDLFTASISIECESLDKDYNKINLSVSIEPIILILHKLTDITISISEVSVIFSQGTFNYIVSKQHEAQRVVPIYGDNAYRKLEVQQLKYLIGASKRLDIIPKTLKSSIADLVLCNNNCYTIYDSIALIDYFKFEPLSIPYEVIRRVVRLLGNKTTYYVDSKHGTLSLKSGNYLINVMTTNVRSIKGTTDSIDKKIKDCSYLTTINLAKFAPIMELISKVYREQRVSFNVLEDDLKLSINSPTANLIVGDSSNAEYLLTASLIPETIKVISSILGTCNKVEVLKGENLICLKSENRYLLISGAIY